MGIGSLNIYIKAGGGSSFGHSASLQMFNCTDEGNRAYSGTFGGAGGISVDFGSFSMKNCVISENPGYTAGGLRLFAPATIDSCTIERNRSILRGASVRCSGGSLTLTNSTIDKNILLGLWVEGSGVSASIVNCTITNNADTVNSFPTGGGIKSDGGGPTVVTNSIVAGNLDGALALDLQDSANSGGFNLIGVGPSSGNFVDGVNGDLVGTTAAPLDPLLHPIGNNGGATPTRTLDLRSPAVGAGDPASAGQVGQRGLPRLAGAVDIGAVEFSFGDVDPLCVPVPNSTGATGDTFVTGSPFAVLADVQLTMASIPPQVFGFFLVSASQGYTPQPGGSAGVLCLGGSIGRLVGPGQIVMSDATGVSTATIDITRIPIGLGTVGTTAGTTWSFQGWHRDGIQGSAQSNFTSGVAVTFR